jgi:hypothetical protein
MASGMELVIEQLLKRVLGEERMAEIMGAVKNIGTVTKHFDGRLTAIEGRLGNIEKLLGQLERKAHEQRNATKPDNGTIDPATVSDTAKH